MLLQHLAERPVGDAVAVGQASAGPAERLRGLSRQGLPELADQARLADTGIAEHRHQAGPALLNGLAVGAGEPPELLVATDEGASQTSHATWTHEGQGSHKSAAAHTFGLSLRLDRGGLAKLERVPSCIRGSLSDQD